MVRVDPANAGVLTRVGPLGIDLKGRIPFDISPEDANLGFFSEASGSRSRIGSVDIADGSAVRGKLTPAGIRLVGIAVLPQS